MKQRKFGECFVAMEKGARKLCDGSGGERNEDDFGWMEVTRKEERRKKTRRKEERRKKRREEEEKKNEALG